MAIIKPFKLDDVREAISNIGIEGMTVTEVQGLVDKNKLKFIEYTVHFLPKLN